MGTWRSRSRAISSPTRRGAQGRRAQHGAFLPGGELRELLRQQFLGLQALPGRVAAVFQRVERHLRPRVVQVAQRIAQRPGAAHHGVQATEQLGRQRLAEVGAVQAAGHRLAQVGLRQLRAGRVDRRERVGQLAAGRVERGMHHGPAQEAAAQLAAHAHLRAHGQGLLVRGVEVEEAQRAGVAAVVQRHQQLAARAKTDLAVRDRALDLRQLPVARVAQLHDAGFVLVAQRQVQRQVDVARQPELVQGLLRGSEWLAGGGGFGHGTILPGSHPPPFHLARALFGPQAA
jgi:hypothetical protein